MGKTVKNQKPKPLSPLLLALLCFWIPVIVFLRISGEILQQDPVNTDFIILNWIHIHASPLLDPVFLAITNIGAPITLMLSATVLAFISWKKRLRQRAFIWFFGVGGAATANFLLKLMFARERPSFWPSIVTEENFSFPSGHAMVSAAFAVCLFVICWRTRWRWIAFLTGASFTFLVGYSRLYFGVHYPTDVISGWAVSAIWVFLLSSVVTDKPFKFRSLLTKLLASILRK